MNAQQSEYAIKAIIDEAKLRIGEFGGSDADIVAHLVGAAVLHGSVTLASGDTVKAAAAIRKSLAGMAKCA